MATYDVTIEREDHYWLVYPHGINGVTQAHTYSDVPAMARACIAMPTGHDRETITIGKIHVKDVSDMVTQATTLRQQAKQARQEATVLMRQAATHLHTRQVPLTEIGVILGLSHQRVSQLLAE